MRARHIPEWEVYDTKIAQFARRLKEKGFIHSGIVDADLSVLADVASGSKSVVVDTTGVVSEGDLAEAGSDTQGRTRDEL